VKLWDDITDSAFHRSWDALHLGQKRVWVNFDRDIIHFSGADGKMADWMPGSSLEDRIVYDLNLLTRFASEDVAKIKNLAVSGTWSDISRNDRSWGVQSPSILPPATHGPLREALDASKHHLTALENLFVHNTDRQRFRMRVPDNQDVVLRDLANIGGEIREFLLQKLDREINVVVLKGFTVVPEHPQNFTPPTFRGRGTAFPRNLPPMPGTFTTTRSLARRTAARLSDIPVMNVVSGNHALQDYQMQLLVLEEQNRRRTRALEEIEADNIGREIDAWQSDNL